MRQFVYAITVTIYLLQISCTFATDYGQELRNRLVIYEGEGGAACLTLFAHSISWERQGGDWLDANGKKHGDHPFDITAVSTLGAAWDVTKIVSRWTDSSKKPNGFFLRAAPGPGYAIFHSAQASRRVDRPMLHLDYSDGSQHTLFAAADTQLDCSTYGSLGQRPTLTIRNGVNAALQFTPPPSGWRKGLKRARLLLTAEQIPNTDIRIAAYELDTPTFLTDKPRHGIATAYPGDVGIERHRDVIFKTGFDDSGNWKSRWASGLRGEVDLIEKNDAFGFAPLQGSALRVNLKKGSNYGADIRLYFRELGTEPEEVFLRYYLRFAQDWNPTRDGGKLPGIAGTYNTAGWGGRRSNGSNGWSLRGAFQRTFDTNHPFHGLTQLSTYAYHADMNSDYGDEWPWVGALLERNRWYCIEQQVRMNTAGQPDGIFRAWVDGHLVLEKTNIRLRKADNIKIETAWLDFYHGGIDPSPHNQHIYVDNVVIAHKYIGPMRPQAKQIDSK